MKKHHIRWIYYNKGWYSYNTDGTGWDCWHSSLWEAVKFAFPFIHKSWIPK